MCVLISAQVICTFYIFNFRLTSCLSHIDYKMTIRLHLSVRTVHFDTSKLEALTVHFLPAGKMTVFVIPLSFNVSQKTVNYRHGPWTLMQLTAQFDSRPSSFACHFEPYSYNGRSMINLKSWNDWKWTVIKIGIGQSFKDQ